jgi:SAM-dependent methyltransferase
MDKQRLFDGAMGRVVAVDMTHRNRDAEFEAVDILDPAPDASVLVLGYGPGVGIEQLSTRLANGQIVGVDPSMVMHKLASKRCAAAIGSGRVRLVVGTVADVGVVTFDGAIAVNTLQLCDPFPETATALARLLRPDAQLVSLTHDWAMKKDFGSVDAGLGLWRAGLEAAGFDEFTSYPGRAEKGGAVVVTARRRAGAGEHCRARFIQPTEPRPSRGVT